MFQSLLESQELSSKQQKRVASLAKKFSPRSSADVAKAYELLFSLYSANNQPALDECIHILTQIPFRGDYRIWVSVEPAYCLKFYLSEDETEKESIQKMLWEETRSPRYDKQEHQDYLQKVMDGLLLESSLEELEKYSETAKEEYELRCYVLSTYLQILALGAQGKYNRAAVLEGIETQTMRLRELHKKVWG